MVVFYGLLAISTLPDSLLKKPLETLILLILRFQDWGYKGCEVLTEVHHALSHLGVALAELKILLDECLDNLVLHDVIIVTTTSVYWIG